MSEPWLSSGSGVREHWLSEQEDEDEDSDQEHHLEHRHHQATQEQQQTLGETSVTPFAFLEEYASICNKNGRIGIYTPEERRSIISRYRDKKKRRVWKKKIRYECRKDLADRRSRVKGRFVKVSNLVSFRDDTALGMTDSKLAGVTGAAAAAGSSSSSSARVNNNKQNPTKRNNKSISSAAGSDRVNSSTADATTIQSNSNGMSMSTEKASRLHFLTSVLGNLDSSNPRDDEDDDDQSDDGATLPRKRLRRHSIAY
jgi:hypothetical protein